MEAENESLAQAACLALVIASRASGGQGAGTGPFLTWNAGEFEGKWAEGKADDVAFISELLDDLSTVVKVDEKRVYAGGVGNGAEVVLVVIEGGCNAWPGQQPPVGFIGKPAKDFSANDLMWEFFQKHKLK